MKKSKTTNIILGLVFISLGVIFFGNNLNIWDIDLFFDGWWTLFIVIPSLISLIRHGANSSAFAGIIIGLLLLLGCQDILSWSIIGKLILPVLFVIIGLTLIIQSHGYDIKKIKHKENAKVLPYTAIFSGIDEKVGKTLEGSKCLSVFGGIDLDLREAKIKEDIVIDCTAIFGGIDLLLPKNVNVDVNGVPIFGGVENKVFSSDKKYPTIHINYVCIFGGVEVK